MTETPTDPAARRFADFYRTSRYAAFPQEHRQDPATGLCAFTVDQQAHDFVDLPTQDWVLGLPLAAQCRTRFDLGDGWRRGWRRRGDMLLVPPGHEVRYEIAGPTRLLIVTWRRGALAALDPLLFGDESQPLAPVVGRYFKSNAVEAACRAIWTELSRKDPAARLLLDTALAGLAAALLRSAAAQVQRGPARRAEIRRALAYIEDNLAGDLRLPRIAAACGLSTFHFLREFAAQTGRTPARYIRERRLDVALGLFAAGRLSEAEIARRVGLSSVRRLREALSRP